jgi:hypothetical protein
MVVQSAAYRVAVGGGDGDVLAVRVVLDAHVDPEHQVGPGEALLVGQVAVHVNVGAGLVAGGHALRG